MNNTHLRIAVVDSQQEALDAAQHNHLASIRAWQNWSKSVFLFVIALLVLQVGLSAALFHQQAVIKAQVSQIRQQAVQNDRQSTAIRYYQHGERFSAAAALASRN